MVNKRTLIIKLSYTYKRFSTVAMSHPDSVVRNLEIMFKSRGTSKLKVLLRQTFVRCHNQQFKSNRTVLYSINV